MLGLGGKGNTALSRQVERGKGVYCVVNRSFLGRVTLSQSCRGSKTKKHQMHCEALHPYRNKTFKSNRNALKPERGCQLQKYYHRSCQWVLISLWLNPIREASKDAAKCYLATSIRVHSPPPWILAEYTHQIRSRGRMFHQESSACIRERP